MTDTLVTSTERVRAILEAGRNASPQTGAIGGDSIDLVVVGMQQLVEGYLGRRLELTARTGKVTRVRRAMNLIRLSAFPVDTEQTFEIRQNYNRDFSSDLSVIPSNEYDLDPNTGLVHMDVPLLGGAGTVRVEWTGGLAANLGDMATNYPDIVAGASLWAAARYRALHRQGKKSESFGRAGSATYDLTEGPPADVRALLDPHRCTMSRADV